MIIFQNIVRLLGALTSTFNTTMGDLLFGTDCSDESEDDIYDKRQISEPTTSETNTSIEKKSSFTEMSKNSLKFYKTETIETLLFETNLTQSQKPQPKETHELHRTQKHTTSEAASNATRIVHAQTVKIPGPLKSSRQRARPRSPQRNRLPPIGAERAWRRAFDARKFEPNNTKMSFKLPRSRSAEVYRVKDPIYDEREAASCSAFLDNADVEASRRKRPPYPFNCLEEDYLKNAQIIDTLWNGIHPNDFATKKEIERDWKIWFETVNIKGENPFLNEINRAMRQEISIATAIMICKKLIADSRRNPYLLSYGLAYERFPLERNWFSDEDDDDFSNEMRDAATFNELLYQKATPHQSDSTRADNLQEERSMPQEKCISENVSILRQTKPQKLSKSISRRASIKSKVRKNTADYHESSDESDNAIQFGKVTRHFLKENCGYDANVAGICHVPFSVPKSQPTTSTTSSTQRQQQQPQQQKRQTPKKKARHQRSLQYNMRLKRNNGATATKTIPTIDANRNATGTTTINTALADISQSQQQQQQHQQQQMSTHIENNISDVAYNTAGQSNLIDKCNSNNHVADNTQTTTYRTLLPATSSPIGPFIWHPNAMANYFYYCEYQRQLSVHYQYQLALHIQQVLPTAELQESFMKELNLYQIQLQQQIQAQIELLHVKQEREQGQQEQLQPQQQQQEKLNEQVQLEQQQDQYYNGDDNIPNNTEAATAAAIVPGNNASNGNNSNSLTMSTSSVEQVMQVIQCQTQQYQRHLLYTIKTYESLLYAQMLQHQAIAQIAVVALERHQEQQQQCQQQLLQRQQQQQQISPTAGQPAAEQQKQQPHLSWISIFDKQQTQQQQQQQQQSKEQQLSAIEQYFSRRKHMPTRYFGPSSSHCLNENAGVPHSAVAVASVASWPYSAYNQIICNNSNNNVNNFQYNNENVKIMQQIINYLSKSSSNNNNDNDNIVLSAYPNNKHFTSETITSSASGSTSDHTTTYEATMTTSGAYSGRGVSSQDTDFSENITEDDVDNYGSEDIVG